MFVEFLKAEVTHLPDLDLRVMINTAQITHIEVYAEGETKIWLADQDMAVVVQGDYAKTCQRIQEVLDPPEPPLRGTETL